MGLIKREKVYRCDNDCVMSGCPSHTMTVEYHSVSDTISLKGSDTGTVYHFDLNKLRTFREILADLDEVRVEINGTKPNDGSRPQRVNR